jgi:hypothetical protein
MNDPAIQAVVREQQAAGGSWQTVIDALAVQDINISRWTAQRAWRIVADTLTVADKAEKVREYLDDRQVYAILDGEAKTHREKRTRGRARVVHSDMVQEQKAYEKELRETANAKTPFESTVKTSLELNKYAQFIEAVGDSDFLQPEAVVDELRSVIKQATIALEKLIPPPVDYEVIDGEAWQARSVRAIT